MLLGMGAGLLGASGWSPLPQSLAQGMAQGLKTGMGWRDEGQRQHLLANRLKQNAKQHDQQQQLGAYRLKQSAKQHAQRMAYQRQAAEHRKQMLDLSQQQHQLKTRQYNDRSAILNQYGAALFGHSPSSPRTLAGQSMGGQSTYPPTPYNSSLGPSAIEGPPAIEPAAATSLGPFSGKATPDPDQPHAQYPDQPHAQYPAQPHAQYPAQPPDPYADLFRLQAATGKDFSKLYELKYGVNRSLQEKYANSLVDKSFAMKDMVIELDEVLRAKELLDSGVFTGTLANFKYELGRMLSTMGFDFAEEATANTEAFVANLVKRTASMVKNFGAGTGISNSDREYAEKGVGSIKMTAKGIRKILNDNIRISQKILRAYNRDLDAFSQQNPNVTFPIELRIPIQQDLAKTPKNTNTKNTKTKKTREISDELRKAASEKTDEQLLKDLGLL
ncbi:MAG: hypothetical protein JAZ10_02265 [Candidatus Thiodiazotropha endolucinida]|nr:hypothetical protein [Candidatus Thiodiazotropha taylori]